MTIFLHEVPNNYIGAAVPGAQVQGTYVIDDVGRGIYAQTASTGSPTLVGYVPITSDGNNGLSQLARQLNAQYFSQPTTVGFGSSLSGTNLTISYPAISILWNGGMQQVTAGSYTAAVTSGVNVYSLLVGYQWGLTAFSYVLTSSLTPASPGIEICRINVNTSTSTATVALGLVNGLWIGSLAVNGPASTSYSISVSNNAGTMPW